ncbi:MAG: amidinotransferase [Bacteroidota bacterium]
MINVQVRDETAPLEEVLLGTAESFGPIPKIEDTYDPKSRYYLEKGQYPKQQDVINELEKFKNVLERYNVDVYHPDSIEDCNQVFVRDLGFVVRNRFILSAIINKREKEIEGIIDHLVNLKPEVLRVPKGVRIEGGDVMPWRDYLFVGYSEDQDFEKYEVSRTNRLGIEFLKNTFPELKVIGIELVKSDDDPYQNALHLDCCFQPFGDDQCILYEGGFKNKTDYEFLLNYFGETNTIKINQEEMFRMNSNIFSINPKTVVSDPSFVRLNGELRKMGMTVEETPYQEISKMEGLFRCTTLPFRRTY